MMGVSEKRASHSTSPPWSFTTGFRAMSSSSVRSRCRSAIAWSCTFRGKIATRRTSSAVCRAPRLPTPSPTASAITWVPSSADVGSYDVTASSVSQGEDVARKHVRIVVDERGHQLFVPGAVSSLFVPNDLQNLGAFAGGGLELVIYSYSSQGSMWVPSHGRFYIDALVFGSSHANVDAMFSTSLGFDLTLEQSPGRRIMLPYVGAQVGIAFQKQEGTFGWAMPLARLYSCGRRTPRASRFKADICFRPRRLKTCAASICAC